MPVHLDTYGAIAKVKGALQIKEFYSNMSIPIIFGGDFNSHIDWAKDVFDVFDTFKNQL